jgi:alkylation response protein AidB-like acyl-CoA dehydrogenase
MNFEFSEDQKFVQQTARSYLAEHSGLDVCRAVLESDRPYDPELWKGVAEMGWLGAAVPEAYGGAGLGMLELVLIAQEVGRALAPIPFASSVLATEALRLFGSEEQRRAHLPRMCAGERIGTFAFAEGTAEPDPADVKTEFDGRRLRGEKLPVLDGDVAGQAVVLAREGAGHALVLVDLDGEGVTRAPLGSFDPSRSQARLVFDGAPAERLGPAGQGAALAERLLDRAAVLIGFEQIGGAERALELTRAFTMGRYAFGRPVASFQALKHRMADVYAKNQIALSHGYYAAWALSHDNEELPIAACGVRVAASDAFTLASEEMVQMHGGVGFTWEYDCHLFYRRARLLAQALGAPSTWREKLVQRLLARGESRAAAANE